MGYITKTVRLTGSSPTSIEDAIRTVLARAAVTIDEIVGFTVVEVSGRVDSVGLPTQFDVTINLSFTVKESIHE